MGSSEIQESVYTWALGASFDAPYGVLQGSHTSKSGRKFLSVTFGRARTLDATVEIYNRNWILVKTSRHGSQSFKDFDVAMEFLKTL